MNLSIFWIEHRLEDVMHLAKRTDEEALKRLAQINTELPPLTKEVRRRGRLTASAQVVS